MSTRPQDPTREYVWPNGSPKIARVTISRRDLVKALATARSSQAGHFEVAATTCERGLLTEVLACPSPRLVNRSGGRCVVIVDSGPDAQWPVAGLDRADAQASIVRLRLIEDENRLTAALYDSQPHVARASVVGPGLPLATWAATAAYVGGPSPAAARWCRLQGVLGKEAFARLQKASIAVVGCGRTGSMIASTLTKAGVARVSLIDPDITEIHNLDAMDVVTPSDIGLPKATAVANRLKSIGSPTSLLPLVHSANSLGAVEATRSADLVICCVDDDGARWITGVLANLYLRPLIDVGVGVFGREATRSLGADIRLILPGDGCIGCFGGVADPPRIKAMTTNAGAFRGKRHWFEERSGSTRSLSHVASGLAMRLIEDLAGGLVASSTWLRAELGAMQTPSILATTPGAEARCDLCEMRGSADAGLDSIPRLAARAVSLGGE